MYGKYALRTVHHVTQVIRIDTVTLKKYYLKGNTYEYLVCMYLRTYIEKHCSSCLYITASTCTVQDGATPLLLPKYYPHPSPTPHTNYYLQELGCYSA